MPFEIPDDDGWDDDVLLAADVTTGGNRGSAAPSAGIAKRAMEPDLVKMGTRPSVEMRDATGAGVRSGDKNGTLEEHAVVPASLAGQLRQTLSKYYGHADFRPCLLYTSPSPRDRQKSRMPSSA